MGLFAVVSGFALVGASCAADSTVVGGTDRPTSVDSDSGTSASSSVVQRELRCGTLSRVEAVAVDTSNEVTIVTGRVIDNSFKIHVSPPSAKGMVQVDLSINGEPNSSDSFYVPLSEQDSEHPVVGGVTPVGGSAVYWSLAEPGYVPAVLHGDDVYVPIYAGVAPPTGLEIYLSVVPVALAGEIDADDPPSTSPIEVPPRSDAMVLDCVAAAQEVMP